MREFFSLEGTFNKYAGFVADTFILSLLWIFFSIPVFTVGASSAALFYVATRRLSNREGYITSDFWQAFKANFIKATVMWLIIFAAILLIIGNMLILILNNDNPDFQMPFASVVLPAQIVILFEVLFINTYIFPVTARFDMGFKQTIKSSFFMANRHMLTTIMCVGTLAALLFLSLQLWPPLLFLTPGIYAMIASYFIMKIFRKYRPEMDKDPMLELQEFEQKRADEKRLAEIGKIVVTGENIKEEIEMGIATYELQNANGMKMKVTNLGCAIISLTVNGVDVVLGLDSAEDYLKKHPFFGVAVGRFANRIGGGKFSLGGKEYQLETNDGEHHLHGGSDGFDKKVWDVEAISGEKIIFSYYSPDGEGGYPGDLNAKISYTLTGENVLRIDYEADTATETICNLTNHSYFNLCGHDEKNVFAQELEIFSDKITEVDEGLIPTGGYVDITGTPFDFRTAKAIGKDLQAAGEINKTGGYDHNYVLRGEGKAASVFSPKTKIRMTVSTNSPGMQLYTGNFVDGTVSGKGVTYQQYSGFCLETQFFPDGINKPEFPSCIVKKGSPQKFYTEFAFEW